MKTLFKTFGAIVIGLFLAIMLCSILFFGITIFLIKGLYKIASGEAFAIKCPTCKTNNVWHSHSEMINTTWMEVYQCTNCKEKFI